MRSDDTIEELRSYAKRDLLSALGIETDAGWGDLFGPMLGVFGVGCLVGAGLGLLFAPQAGSDLRQNIRQKLTKAPRRGVETAHEEPYHTGYEGGANTEMTSNVGTPGPM
jgi:hypothetical protein